MTKPTAIIFRKELLEHELPGHVFRSRERLTFYLDLVKKYFSSEPQVKIIEPDFLATDEDILAVHDSSLLRKIEELSEEGGTLDADTPVPQGTFGRAKIQAGGSIYGAKKVIQGEFERAVQCLTLGGHHATRSYGRRTFGFCYFNQQAIVTRYLQRKGYIKKALILDCDAHHGNGIQDIFYQDPSVLYVSFHQDPRTLYPCTGSPQEVGKGEGAGYTINCPIPRGTSGASYLKLLKSIFTPIASSYKPNLIYLIIGADVHFADPLTRLSLEIKDIKDIVEEAVRVANEVCQGRIIMELGGGYEVEISGYAFLISTASLAEAPVPQIEESSKPQRNPKIEEICEALVREYKSYFAQFWPSLQIL